MMKIKKIISLIILALFIVSSSVQAQGIYNNNKSVEKKVPPKGTTTSNGGIYASRPGAGPDGMIGEQSDSPIGDGLLLLTLLAGGYFIVKSRKTRKNEV
jgi:hypothetical protein